MVGLSAALIGLASGFALSVLPLRGAVLAVGVLASVVVFAVFAFVVSTPRDLRRKLARVPVTELLLYVLRASRDTLRSGHLYGGHALATVAVSAVVVGLLLFAGNALGDRRAVVIAVMLSAVVVLLAWWQVGHRRPIIGRESTDERAGRTTPSDSRSDPAHACTAAYRLALVLQEHGDRLGAEEAFARADGLGHAEAAVHVGLLAENRRQHSAAEAAFRRADRRGSSSGSYRLGLLLRRQGRSEQAAVAFRRAAARGHGHGAFYVALLLEEAGDPEAARRFYELSRSLGDAHAEFVLRNNLSSSPPGGRPLLLDEALLRAADAEGEPAASFELGEVLYQAGDYDGGAAAYARADEGGHPVAAFRLGVLLEARGDATGAEAAFRRAASLGSVEGLRRLALLLAAQQRENEAIAAYQSADIAGDRQSAYALGEILEARGDLNAALAAFRRAESRTDAGPGDIRRRGVVFRIQRITQRTTSVSPSRPSAGSL